MCNSRHLQSATMEFWNQTKICCSGHHLQRVPRCGPYAADLKNLTGLARRKTFQALTLQGPPWHFAATWVRQTTGRPPVAPVGEAKLVTKMEMREAADASMRRDEKVRVRVEDRWKIDGRSMFEENTHTFRKIIDQTMSVSRLTGFTCLPSRGMADFTGFTEWDFQLFYHFIFCHLRGWACSSSFGQ